MEINYELEQKDLIDFSNQLAKSQSAHKIIAFFLAALIIVFIFADLLYLILSGSGNFGSFDSILINIFIRILIAFGLLGGAYITALLMQKRGLDKVKSFSNNGILCEHKIVLDENEFIEITDVNTSKHSWLSVGEIQELDDFVLINVNFVGIHFIPKRYFDDQTHIKEFVETAQYYKESAKEKFNSSHLAAFDRNSNLLS